MLNFADYHREIEQYIERSTREAVERLATRSDEDNPIYRAAYAGTLAAIRDSRSSIDISLGKLGGQFDEQAIADAARKGWEAANDAGSRAPG